MPIIDLHEFPYTVLLNDGTEISGNLFAMSQSDATDCLMVVYPYGKRFAVSPAI